VRRAANFAGRPRRSGLGKEDRCIARHRGQAGGSVAPAMPADGGYCGEHGFRASAWRNTLGFVLKAGRSPASRCPRELFEQVI